MKAKFWRKGKYWGWIENEELVLSLHSQLRLARINNGNRTGD